MPGVEATDLIAFSLGQRLHQALHHLRGEDLRVCFIETLEVLQRLQTLVGHGVDQTTQVVVPRETDRRIKG